MSNIRKTYWQMKRQEELDKGEGAYPIWFSSYWEKYKFVQYCRWRKFVEGIKKRCHL